MLKLKLTTKLTKKRLNMEKKAKLKKKSFDLSQ